MGLAEVSNILWQERQLMELLLFKLEEEQLVLASGRSRWLNHATREVEMVLEEIKRAEVARAVEVTPPPPSWACRRTRACASWARRPRLPGKASSNSTAVRSSPS